MDFLVDYKKIEL